MTDQNNKPILSAPGDIYLSEDGITEIVTRLLDCDAVFALGVAKMLEKAAKRVIGETKGSVLDEIEQALAGSKKTNTVEVGDAKFTYRNGKASHSFAGLADWEAADKAVTDARIRSEELRDKLLAENEDYQRSLFDFVQAEKQLEAVEKRLIEKGETTIITQAATVAVKFT